MYTYNYNQLEKASSPGGSFSESEIQWRANSLQKPSRTKTVRCVPSTRSPPSNLTILRTPNPKP